MAFARRAARALQWTGPLELEFALRRAPGDAEANPVLHAAHCRLPGWSASAAWAGLNLPALYAAWYRVKPDETSGPERAEVHQLS